MVKSIGVSNYIKVPLCSYRHRKPGQWNAQKVRVLEGKLEKIVFRNY